VNGRADAELAPFVDLGARLYRGWFHGWEHRFKAVADKDEVYASRRIVHAFVLGAKGPRARSALRELLECDADHCRLEPTVAWTRAAQDARHIPEGNVVS